MISCVFFFQKRLDMVMYNLYLNKWVGEVFYEFKATQVYKSSSGIARNLSQKKKKTIMKK